MRKKRADEEGRAKSYFVLRVKIGVEGGKKAQQQIEGKYPVGSSVLAVPRVRHELEHTVTGTPGFNGCGPASGVCDFTER